MSHCIGLREGAASGYLCALRAVHFEMLQCNVRLVAVSGSRRNKNDFPSDSGAYFRTLQATSCATLVSALGGKRTLAAPVRKGPVYG
jgi:hypothetical protein